MFNKHSERLIMQISIFFFVFILIYIFILNFDSYLYKIILKSFILIYPLILVRPDSISGKFTYTDLSTNFRVPQPWPDAWAAIQFRIMWPKIDRKFPSEIRIMSSSCDNNSILEVNVPVMNNNTFLGNFALEKNNVWSIPIYSELFDNNIITLRIKQQMYRPNCGIILNYYENTSSLKNNNISLYYEKYGNIDIIYTNSRYRNGVVLAQIWDPRF